MTHSEEWWELLAGPTAVRCEGHYKTGERCRREAIPGGTVCKQHGGAAPHVQAVAAARIGNAADQMAALLIEWANDPDVEVRERAKIAQDLLDRAGLNATEKHIVGVGPIDPVEALFKTILNDPNGLAPAQPILGEPSPQALAWNRAALDDDEPADIVDAEVVAETRVTESMSSKPPKHILLALERLI